MIDIRDISISSGLGEIRAHGGQFGVRGSLKDFVNDLARETERKAKELAPLGPTGALKMHGVIRHDAIETIVPGTFSSEGAPGSHVTEAPAFGGGFLVRGGNPANRGQFTSASKSFQPGHVFGGTLGRSDYTAVVELNPQVQHSIWVHNGTGIYGPRRSPIVPRRAKFLVFNYRGRKWVKRSVKGQRPQPFLTESFDYVNDVYTPAKMTELKAAIAART